MLPSTILHQKPGPQWAFVPHADAEEIAQTLVAFANSEGGTVCMGVGADGRLGTIFTPEEAADALMAAQRLCRPPVPTQWQQEQVPGGASTGAWRTSHRRAGLTPGGRAPGRRPGRKRFPPSAARRPGSRP